MTNDPGEMINGLDIVRQWFPTATEDEAGYILWNETGWPCFWDGDDAVACLHEQLKDLSDRIFAE